PVLPSFPTRRSSDLEQSAVHVVAAAGGKADHEVNRFAPVELHEGLGRGHGRSNQCNESRSGERACLSKELHVFCPSPIDTYPWRSEEHTSELQSRFD